MDIALNNPSARTELPKALTGIAGLDAVTFGGFPAGRPTLICGLAGCGKTLFGMTFLVEGATQFGEPGVLMSFEETAEDLAANVNSLGYDVDQLVADKQIVIDYVRVERSEIEQSGEYDLEGLFVRLGFAIDQIGAKRVVLDTLEALFAGLGDESTLRSELRRLFQWLKDKGVTAVITAERGDGQLTRHGLEEYVSDCVILLDNRVIEQVSTRRLLIVKYRGSAHGSNEYPFLIDTGGISVLPITTAGLAHGSSNEVVPSGVAGIDAMLGAGGFYKGSSILVSGTSGTGKTIIASQFADAVCARGDTCLFFAFEESPEQIMRNVASVGIDLRRHVEAGLLRFVAARPSLYGLEMHLTLMHREVELFNPTAVVLDPISAFYGPTSEIHAMLLRMVDLLKAKGTTGVFTDLTSLALATDQTDVGLSSLMDTWIGLHDIEANGERNRGLYLLKSRGMSHSNQIREYLLTDNGVELIKPYLGSSGVLTGTARTLQEAREAADALVRRQDVERREREFRQRRAHAERQFAETKAALDAEEEELRILAEEARSREYALDEDRATISAVRGNAQ